MGRLSQNQTLKSKYNTVDLHTWGIQLVEQVLNDLASVISLAALDLFTSAQRRHGSAGHPQGDVHQALEPQL